MKKAFCFFRVILEERNIMFVSYVDFYANQSNVQLKMKVGELFK